MMYQLVRAVVAFLTICFVDGQLTGQITRLAEPVVKFAGESATVPCWVSSPPGSNIIVTWSYLNSTSGSKTITQSCNVADDNNSDEDGELKYEIECPPSQGTVIYYLTVNSLALQDSGMYQCGTYVEGASSPTDIMPVTITVLSPPKMAFAASTLVADSFLGMNVTMTCMAEGEPAPNVTWGKANGKPLPDKGRSYQVKLPAGARRSITDLTILNLTKEDRGSYRCSADNSVRPPDQMYSSLSIEFAPSVAPVEPSYGAATSEATAAMLWCQVDGNPRPVMSWYVMSPAQTSVYEKGDLKLDNVFFANAAPILTDDKYKVEQKIMTVGSLSTMESMFYSLTLRTVENSDYVYYVCQAKNTHGEGAVAMKLYRVNTLTDESRSSAVSSTYLPIATFIAALVTLLL